MKTEKYLCDTLKAILRGQRAMFWSYDTDVVISKDGCSGILIPKSKNPFNNFVNDNHIIPDSWHENEMTMMPSATIKGNTIFRFF